MPVDQTSSTTSTVTAADVILDGVKAELRRQTVQSAQAPFTTQKSTLRGPNVEPPSDGFKAEAKVELGKDGKPLKKTTAEKSLNAKNAAEFQKLFESGDVPKDTKAQLKDLKWGVDNIKDPQKLVDFVKETVETMSQEPQGPGLSAEGEKAERPTLREGKLSKAEAKETERGEQRRLLQKAETGRASVKGAELLRTLGHLSDPKKISEQALKTFAGQKGLPSPSQSAGKLSKVSFKGTTSRGGGAGTQGSTSGAAQQAALQKQLKAIKDPQKFARFAEKAMGLDKATVAQGTVLSKELQRELLRHEATQTKKEEKKLLKTPHPLDMPFGGKEGSPLTPSQFFAAALHVYSQNPPRFRAYMAAFFAQHFASYGQGIAAVSQGGSQNATKGQTGGSFKQGQSGNNRR